MSSADEEDNSEFSKLHSSEERWRKSPSPPDPWVGEEDAEWAYKIISEEVDYDDNVLYEVRWEDWKRADGTNTTWERADKTTIDSSEWSYREKKLRGAKANQSLSIDVPTTTDVHNTETFLRSQAYAEKLARIEKEPQPNRVHEMEKLLAEHEQRRLEQGASARSSQLAAANPAHSRRRSARQQSESSIASSSTTFGRTGSRGMSASSSATVASATAKPPRPSLLVPNDPIPSSSKAKGKQRALVPDLSPPPTDFAFSPRKRVKRVPAAESTDDLLVVPSTSSFMVEASPANSRRSEDTPAARRQRLHKKWTQAAKLVGAASISIVNIVDNEATPPLDPQFLYLECGYKFASDVEPPDEGFLTSCDCSVCGPHPTTCGCQDEWTQDDFAYTPSGLFAFNVPINTEVIECNKNCACTVETCVNRVSQLPRNIPIEIFKTRECGWGVRSPRAVPRGKVLGIYTGHLIRREASRALPPHLAAYTFDLDGDELVDNQSQPSQYSQQSGGKYTVDSRAAGNWTRFINHSCSPNLEIYLVTHDKPAGSGMPYIAFVANQPIPAQTEFTFDYHPEIAFKIKSDALAKGKSHKKKTKVPAPIPIPEDATQCMCGSRECRGYLT